MKMRKILFATGDVVPNGGQGYFPQDIQQLYNIPAGLTGQGQTIGILEFSNGYSLRDAEQFWNLHGISSPQVTFVSVDGTANDGGTSPNDEEATLDLQWAGAIAPGAHILVYEANGGSTYAEFAQAITRTLQYILNDTQYHPSVLSISYGDGEISFNPSDVQQWAALVAQLDAKGITVCISSGDQGAYGLHDLNGPLTRHADAPATIPSAVAVGGTSLQPDGTETAWTYNGPQNGGATGGGFSDIFPQPAYQNGIAGAGASGSGTSGSGTSGTTGPGRGIPDVACNADPATGYQIIFQGQPAVVGGTSVSSPVFAAVVALANEQREQNGLPALTGLTQTLYTNALQPAYRDITVGNNSFNGVTGYNATPGWDACTGFGSFDATKFISMLSTSSVTSGSVSSASTPSPQAPAPAAGGTQPTPDTQPNSQPAGQPVSEPEPVPVRHEGGALPKRPQRDREFLVRVEALIEAVEADGHFHGASHHHLLINQIRVLKVWNGTQLEVSKRAFVAIRYGDALGLPGPIPDLAPGQQIVMQGRYIPKNHVYPSIGNPGDAVIDETHLPFGFVLYQGHMYR